MESNSSYSVQWLSDVEIPLANKFYRAHGFRGKARRNESCAVVRDSQAAIVACGYLRDYQDFRLLAGIAVAVEHQGRGVARLLLADLSQKFDSQTYTFPYRHLVPFYRSLGFELCELETGEQKVGEQIAGEQIAGEQIDVQPLSVVDLYQRYREQGREIAVMLYGAR